MGLGDKKYDSLSVHCDWEASLEDLLPLPDPEYAYKSDREGVERWHTLGAAPGKAFASLSDGFFGFKELEGKAGMLEAEARRERLPELKGKVREALEDHTRRLEANQWGEQEREVLERWLKELEEYDPSLGEDSFLVFSAT